MAINDRSNTELITRNGLNWTVIDKDLSFFLNLKEICEFSRYK